jgi:hypothetical protein
MFHLIYGCLAQMRARKKPLNDAGLRGRRSNALQQPPFDTARRGSIIKQRYVAMLVLLPLN